MVQSRVVGFGLMVAALGVAGLAGCSNSAGTESPGADGGADGSLVAKHDTGVTTHADTGHGCTPNSQQCATSTIAEVCNSDGTAWTSIPCGSGQTCSNGVCGGDSGSGSKCPPNAKQCVTPTLAEVCPSDGSGWLAVACPTGQGCTGGVCAGDAGKACTPNAQECVNSTLARVCPADGSGWLAVPCPQGEVCAGGTCTFTLDAPCAPGTGGCVSANQAIVCNAQGTGYEQVTCPGKTTCGGMGNCYGAVEVGSSQCESLTTLATSTDGFTYTSATCPTGTYCVATSTATAACLAGNCTPDTSGNNCDSVCGNKVDTSADQTKYISTCYATATGYQWVAVECASPETCNPNGTLCFYGGPPAPACGSLCTPSATRCAPDGSGVQTCKVDGTWGGSTACNLLEGQVCGTVATTGMGACGDPVCFATGSTGTCTPSGAFQACTASFTLEPVASATPCPAGETCQPQSGYPVPGGYQPGACTATCTPGSKQCSGGGVATCTNAGVWGAPVACHGSKTCQPYASSTGEVEAVCGTCVPGAHQCSGSDIETCGPNGNWGAATPCDVGSCQPSGTDFACATECVPNAPKVCGGVGGVQLGSCSARGTFGAFHDCPTGQSCRVDSDNNAIGCITCLGPSHGLQADTECTTDTAGVPGSTATDTCGADDTWLPPTKCTGGESCVVTGILQCKSFTQAGINVAGTSINPAELVTQSNIASAIMGGGCANLGTSATPCGDTPDCCTNSTVLGYYGFCGSGVGPVCQLAGGSGTGIGSATFSGTGTGVTGGTAISASGVTGNTGSAGSATAGSASASVVSGGAPGTTGTTSTTGT